MPADPQAAAREATRLVLIRCVRSSIAARQGQMVELQRQLLELSRMLARLEQRQ